MIPLFENAGLIGLGLIGGSLARVMRKHGLAKNIIGYTKSPQSSSKALEIGMIDEIAASVSDIAARCDIIIISTPLSSYDVIAGEIAVSIKESTIITDVGSLKNIVIKTFRQHLSDDNLKFLVPAHPIAGTEKTGVESGFAELFEGKKTIITPIATTSLDAITKVSKLWQACGSKVQEMQASEHDNIYAEVSHLPQFLAYCYGHLLQSCNADLSNLKNDKDFWIFTRICASDPAIWLDIFIMNQENLLEKLKNFITAFIEINEVNLPLPTIISSALINCSPNAPEFSGSGFKDFTSYTNHRNQILVNSTDEFIAIVNIFAELLHNEKPEELLGLMQNASHCYREFKKQNLE